MLKIIIIALLIGAVLSKKVRNMVRSAMKKYSQVVMNVLVSGLGLKYKTARKIKIVIDIILTIMIIKIIF